MTSKGSVISRALKHCAYSQGRAIYSAYWQLRQRGIYMLDYFWGENVKIVSSTNPPQKSKGDRISINYQVVMFDFDLTISQETLGEAKIFESGLADMLYFTDIMAGQCKRGLGKRRLHWKFEQRDVRDLSKLIDARR